MTYPSEILPQQGYKKIEKEDYSHFYFLRITKSKSDIIHPLTNHIKDEYLVANDAHLLGWSCNLYDHYCETHVGFIPTKAFNDEWDYSGPSPIMKYNVDFEYDENRGLYYVPLQGLRDLQFPYKKENITGLISRPIIEHCPTIANFWHMEIRWSDNDGTQIKNSKSAWVQGILSQVKSYFREHCTVEKPEEFRRLENNDYNTL